MQRTKTIKMPLPQNGKNLSVTSFSVENGEIVFTINYETSNPILEDLELTVGLFNTLKKRRINNIEDLQKHSLLEIARWPGMGVKKLKELESICETFKFSLRKHFQGNNISLDTEIKALLEHKIGLRKPNLLFLSNKGIKTYGGYIAEKDKLSPYVKETFDLFFDKLSQC